ncbi:MAG: Ig-like domain-containing protein, partial [Bacteroidota bacterium]|nr:Ig-like domain-containing protein [Bacteroidota bacterium]
MNAQIRLFQWSVDFPLKRGFRGLRRELLSCCSLILLAAVLASSAAAQSSEIVLSTTSLRIAETGEATYTVHLATQPSARITVTITSSAGTDLTLDETDLTFTISNWSVPQMVMVMAADVNSNDEWKTETLVHTATGGDYEGETASLEVSIYNYAQFFGVMAGGDNTVSEGGSTVHTVSVSGPPPTPAMVGITGWQGTDVELDMTSLTFTTSNWSVPQTVTISADEDDDICDENVSLTYQLRIGEDEYGVTTRSVKVNDDKELVVTITGVPARINSATPITATFAFSEPVTGFEAGDVTVLGGTKGTFTAINATTYRLVINVSSGVTVIVNPNTVTVGCGDTGPSSAVSAHALFDFDAPALTIGGLPARINSVTPLSVTFTFSEAVTGFETNDVTVSGGTKGTFSGSGTTYTLAVTPEGSKDVVVTVAADAAADVDGDTGPASDVTATAIWDATAPALTINDVPPKINSVTAFTAEFVFSEAVTGFAATDITITGGTEGTFTAKNATTYTLDVTPTGSADVVVTVAADVATDGDSNTGPASAVSMTATWDATRPTVEITGVPAKINSTTQFTATFTFSEAVTGFDTGGVFLLFGGTKGTFTAVSATSYTLAVTPTNGSNVVVTVVDNSATDGLNTGPASAVTATAT